MRNIFALAVVLNLVALLGPYVPASALGGWGCGLHHRWCGGGGYGYGGCGYGGYGYGGCGYGGWANAGYLYGGGCGSGGFGYSGYGYGYGGYGYDWRYSRHSYGVYGHGGFGYPSYGYGGYGYGGCSNCFSVVPADSSSAVASRSVARTPAVASVEAEFENRIVAAAERVLRPSIAGPASTFVTRIDAAPTSKNTSGRNPDLAEVLAGEARHLYWARSYQESLKMLEEAVRADEQSASAWYFKGLCHRALGNAKGAEASFAKAVAYYPTDSAGERRMSQILERVQGSLRIQLENARLKVRRDLATSPVVVTASR